MISLKIREKSAKKGLNRRKKSVEQKKKRRICGEKTKHRIREYFPFINEKEGKYVQEGYCTNCYQRLEIIYDSQEEAEKKGLFMRKADTKQKYLKQRKNQ